MTFLNIRSALVFFGLATSMALVPTTASAKGSVHIDIPGISIGYSDNHYGKNYRQKRHYNNHRRHNRKHNYYNKRHYNQSYSGYGYSDRSYRNNDRGYSDRRYNNQSRTRYYERDNYCPDPGYSTRAYRDQSCYSHGDHYHCN